MRPLFWRLAALFRRRTLDVHLDDEVRAHLDLLEAEYVRSGMTPGDARYAARRAFGGVEQMKERHRERRSVAWIEDARRDAGYALRTLGRNRAFAAMAIATLALGVGATASMFTVVRGVLLRPLPYPEPDRLVQVWQVGEDGRRLIFSAPNFEDVKQASRSFAAMARFGRGTAATLTAGTEAVRANAIEVSDDFFRVLGVEPVLGQVFPAASGADAAAAIVSHRVWQDSLAARRDLTGISVTVRQQIVPVVGVLPEGFAFPFATDIWVSSRSAGPRGRTAHTWQVMARLADGVTVEQAQEETSGIARRLREQYGSDTWMVDTDLLGLQEQLVGRVRPALLVLFAASVSLLLIACANVANLMIARTSARGRELAVRLALGASRGRVLRQLLMESLVLSVVASVVGVLLASWGTTAALAALPLRLPAAQPLGVDWAVATFAVVVSAMTALAVGLVAALRASRQDVRGRLATTQRTATAGGMRVRQSLIATQVALTLVLLIGAALLGRSLLSLLAVDPGYRTDDIVVVDFNLPVPEAESSRRIEFHERLLARLGTVPGVDALGTVNDLPLGGNYPDGTFLVLNGRDDVRTLADYQRVARDPARRGTAGFRVASEGYFSTLGIPLVRGRLFDGRDAIDAPHVAVISESLARGRWPDQDPIGQWVQFGNMDGDYRALTVVGVVGDIRERSLDGPPPAIVYGSSRQRPGAAGRVNVVVRGPRDRDAFIGAARSVVRDLDPQIVPRFRTLDALVTQSVTDRRFSLLLLTAFGGIALLLALAGIYSVISVLTLQRTQEVGVRIALGARRGQVLAMFVRQAFVPTAAGVVGGLLVAAGVTRYLSQMLYGLTPIDPLTFASVAVAFISAAAAASYIPARRAATLPPIIALRSE